MSSRSDHDSMDDVLASIRRIVRAETAAEPAESKADTPQTEAEAGSGLVPEGKSSRGEPAPEAGIGGDMSGTPALAKTSGQEAGEDPAPLLLTPEMRADRASGRSPAGPATPAPEREILRMLIAEIVAAEMRGDAIRDVLRDIIRDELTNGPLGENATRNVRAMIRAEIAATNPEGR
ncbi:MAG TPA: hypothetical protein VK090_03755 [Paracoccaceae bacterium]|nr:hypothetical protein [Paracoccaceae bacterium]